MTSSLSKTDASANKEKGVAGAAKNVMAEDENDKEIQLENQDGKKLSSEEANIYPITTPTFYFHGVMLFACCYYAMLFTNWGDPVWESSKNDYFEANLSSYWIKIII